MEQDITAIWTEALDDTDSVVNSTGSHSSRPSIRSTENKKASYVKEEGSNNVFALVIYDSPSALSSKSTASEDDSSHMLPSRSCLVSTASVI